MRDKNTDQNTTQPVYRLNVPVFLLSLEGVTMKVSVCNMFLFVSFAMCSLRKTVGKSVTDSGYAEILISNVRTSASKKINLMALIRTLTISTTTFERMKEKLYGFRQTVCRANSQRSVCAF